ncbi:MAG: PEP-CTERM sorting domain-containing protein [Pirellulales bacterium]|nr:PEP-CTERM sorting domain-containing protein [Pirellulales bacterium]
MKATYHWTFTLLAAAALATSASSRTTAASIVLNTVADTYSRAGVNAGAAPVMDIRDFATPDFIGYFRFDLSSVPAPITGAKLTLHKVPSARNDTIVTARFANFGLTNAAGNTPQNWDELTVADTGLGAEYNTVGGDPLILGQFISLDFEAGANVTETVNNNVTPQMLEGPDLVAFLEGRRNDGGLATIINAVLTVGRGWGWATKENADPLLHPTLEITYDVIPEPTSAGLLALGACAALLYRRK